MVTPMGPLVTLHVRCLPCNCLSHLKIHRTLVVKWCARKPDFWTRGIDSLVWKRYAFLKNKKPNRCHLLFLFYFLETQHVSVINTAIIRSLRLCCWTTTLAVSWFAVCWSLGAVRSNRTQTPIHIKPRTKSANIVVQQHSRKLLKMSILMPETCLVSKKKNKYSKWHLLGFLFFNYHKTHGPINIKEYNILNLFKLQCSYCRHDQSCLVNSD